MFTPGDVVRVAYEDVTPFYAEVVGEKSGHFLCRWHVLGYPEQQGWFIPPYLTLVREALTEKV